MGLSIDIRDETIDKHLNFERRKHYIVLKEMISKESRGENKTLLTAIPSKHFPSELSVNKANSLVGRSAKSAKGFPKKSVQKTNEFKEKIQFKYLLSDEKMDLLIMSTADVKHHV